jgi:hypothetical protein
MTIHTMANQLVRRAWKLAISRLAQLHPGAEGRAAVGTTVRGTHPCTHLSDNLLACAGVKCSTPVMRLYAAHVEDSLDHSCSWVQLGRQEHDQRLLPAPTLHLLRGSSKR